MADPINLSKNVYYVYSHSDPRTGEIRYIGKGSGPRAWILASARSPEHIEWYRELEFLGYGPMDIVTIHERNLPELVARDREDALIDSMEPGQLFNLRCGPGKCGIPCDFKPTVIERAGTRWEYSTEDIEAFCAVLGIKTQIRAEQVTSLINQCNHWFPLETIVGSDLEHTTTLAGLKKLVQQFEAFLELRNSIKS